MLGRNTFAECQDLKRVVLSEGLERLVTEENYHGKNRSLTDLKGIFTNSEVEEIVLPSTLLEMRGFGLKGCVSLKIIWVGDGCTADVRESVSKSVAIMPAGRLEQITVQGIPLTVLRNIRVVSLPEGIEKIGCCWFAKSGIESAAIPASVKEIGKLAFWKCKISDK